MGVEHISGTLMVEGETIKVLGSLLKLGAPFSSLNKGYCLSFN